MKRSSFTVDVQNIARMADKLGVLGGAALTADADVVSTLNRVVDKVYETGRGRMVAGINLSEAYIDNHMQVIHATPERGLRAEITAFGGKNHQTPLGRYMVGVVKKPGKKGKPVNAGVEVEVGRGRNVVLQNAWVMPLRRGSEAGGNGDGIFLRTRYGVVRHRYGPAPYQLFRAQVPQLEDDLGDLLEDQIGDAAQRALEKYL